MVAATKTAIERKTERRPKTRPRSSSWPDLTNIKVVAVTRLSGTWGTCGQVEGHLGNWYTGCPKKTTFLKLKMIQNYRRVVFFGTPSYNNSVKDLEVDVGCCYAVAKPGKCLRKYWWL